MNARHAAVVLAAGGSRRLGRPKQFLTRDGEALVRRAVRQAIDTRPVQLVVIVGAYDEAMAAAMAGLDCQLLANPRWKEGISSSLQCAAQQLRAHAGPVLILGCDQPALAAGHLQQLLTGAVDAPSGCAATVHAGRLGIPAVIPAAVLQQVHTLAGDRGFGDYLNTLPPGTVWGLAAPELQFDIDTPENEQAAIARGLLDPSR
ncbi:NTP transferase domain-containing protein [Lysobacter niabensis]|uniref:nucleotidyltransferase family protein n=1 Tax=Agrilutibacter niabensis TaxID=380628 RepID=UPI00360B8921